jgi:hypothetical protein
MKSAMVSTRRLFFSWPELFERLLQAADGLIQHGRRKPANSLVALSAGMLLMTNEGDYRRRK